MPRNRRRPSNEVRTPQEQTGTTEGMLFQVDGQIEALNRHVDRLRGDIAYLKRRRKKLVMELSHRGKERGGISSESNSGGNT